MSTAFLSCQVKHPHAAKFFLFCQSSCMHGLDKELHCDLSIIVNRHALTVPLSMCTAEFEALHILPSYKLVIKFSE